MKRMICTTIALMLLLTACAAPATSEPASTEYVHTPYVSTITAEECFICSESKATPTGLYWGEDNVGLLDLNTFEVLRIEINRYENGKLIETPSGFMQTTGMNSGGVYATTDPDRGYAHVRISGANGAIDTASIQSHLCQTCLDEINGMYFGDYPPEAYAIVNFTDKTIRPLIQNTTFFGSGNYGVDCEFKDDGGDIDLLIFYCPPRYQ
jgi:hypothetical protein